MLDRSNGVIPMFPALYVTGVFRRWNPEEWILGLRLWLGLGWGLWLGWGLGLGVSVWVCLTGCLSNPSAWGGTFSGFHLRKTRPGNIVYAPDLTLTTTTGNSLVTCGEMLGTDFAMSSRLKSRLLILASHKSLLRWLKSSVCRVEPMLGMSTMSTIWPPRTRWRL